MEPSRIEPSHVSAGYSRNTATSRASETPTGIPEMEGSFSETQKDKDADKKISIVMAVLFLCLIVAAAAVLFTSGVFSESREDIGVDSSNDNGVGENAEVSSDWYPEVEPNESIKSSSWPTSILLCTAEYLPEIPDGLCDMVVYRGGLLEDAGYYNLHYNAPLFNRFCAAAKIAKKTMYGADVLAHDVEITYMGLTRPEGQKSIQSAFRSNVRHYGTLTTILYRGSSRWYVQAVINLLNTFRELQLNFSSGSKEIQSYIFYGVAPLYHGQYDNDTAMRDDFDEVIKKANPDIVLFRTTLVREEIEHSYCVVTGTSVWSRPLVKYQPSFTDSLIFRSRVTLPRRVRQLLSFSVCGISYVPKQYFLQWHHLGTRCKSARMIGPFQWICSGEGSSKTLFLQAHYERLLVYLWEENEKHLFVYESAQSILEKMCRASKDYKYSDGWTMFETQCSDITNVCNDTTCRDGFATIRLVKNVINFNMKFDRCYGLSALVPELC